MRLRLEGISKRYGSHTAICNLSLELGPGMVGLVGPNGAGKTTLMRMIATLIPQSSGVIRWNDLDTRSAGVEIRRVLGYLPQEFGLYPEFTGRKFLRYMAVMKGLPAEFIPRRVDEVLELVNLERDADRRLRTYSGGMRQRIGIAQALLNDPELLIVDEPTAGLDPAERVRFRTLLAGLTIDRLILLSTHIVSDVEAVASHLIILRQGEMVADTTPQGLLGRAADSVWSLTVDPGIATRLQAAYPVSALITGVDGVTMRVISEDRPSEQATCVPPTLEDAYLSVISDGGTRV